MTRLKFFLLGAIAVTSVSAIAAGPTFFAAIPIESCSAISNVALSTTHEVVLAADPQRKSFCISNNDASIATYVAYHTTATSADVRLGPGQTLCENVYGNYIYTGVVDMLAASSTPAIGGFSCR